MKEEVYNGEIKILDDVERPAKTSGAQVREEILVFSNYPMLEEQETTFADLMEHSSHM